MNVWPLLKENRSASIFLTINRHQHFEKAIYWEKKLRKSWYSNRDTNVRVVEFTSEFQVRSPVSWRIRKNVGRLQNAYLKKYQKNAFLKVQGLYADNLKYFKLNRSEVAFTPRI